MNRLVLAFAVSFLAQLLPAQDVTYVVFNRDCMNQLVYRYAYPNVKGDDPVYAYSIQPNVLENYVFISKGAGHYSPTMPPGAVTCLSLELSDGFVASVNRSDRQMLIVFQRQEGGYWLMPIGSATLIARSGPKYWVRSKNCVFTFDTLRMENDRNLSVAGSPTAVYFKGAQVNNCLMEYSFHCESIKSGQLRSDIEMIPSIGFISDQTGTSGATALENEMQLYRVNGQDIGGFIGKGCPEETKIAISKYQKATQYGYEKEAYGYSNPDKEIASIQNNKAAQTKPAEYNYGGETVTLDCPEKLGDGYHVVQKGDNLRAIARTYNVDVPSLVKWNKIKDPNAIEVCQVIWYKKPPANADKLVPGAAPKPIQHTSDGYHVVDQRKVNKMTNEKTVKPQEYTTEDVNYDSWRQKPQSASKGVVKPQQYEYYDEAKPDSDRPLIHTIVKGEYLYKLAKMYNCPEECIRQANNMPASGDITFSIGEKVIIPEGDCLKTGRLSKKSVPYDEPVNTADRKNQKMNSGGTLLDPVAYNYDDLYSPPPTEGKKEPEKKYVDEWAVEDKLTSSINAKDKTSTKGGSSNTNTPKVPQFKEHLARQGDTIRSIATKHKVDPAELAQVNGLGLNEAIVPGKWILVPIEE